MFKFVAKMKSKALLLLFIFLLNTVTGFACALRMSIHKHEEAIEHHHESGEATEHHHEEHQQASLLSAHSSQLVLNGTYITKDDPCCQGAVNNFIALAKVVPQSGHIILLPPFTYICSYYHFFSKPISDSQSKKLVSVSERRRPPKHPVRIAIQSFQI